jgi:hypothetical protein
MENPLPHRLVQWNRITREEAVNTFDEGLPGGHTKNLKKQVLATLLPRLVRRMMVQSRKVLHKVTLLVRLVRRTMIFLRPSRRTS